MTSIVYELCAVQGNHIYTSGSIGTNAAVIKGALRANAPDKLTVILPQSLKKQPTESQDLLTQVRCRAHVYPRAHVSLKIQSGRGVFFWRVDAYMRVHVCLCLCR